MIISAIHNRKKPQPPVTLLPGQFKYKVSGTKKVSATAWNKDGKMVRTIFSNRTKTGDNVDWWDGKDDNGNPVPSGDYKIKGIGANIAGVPIGIIGNTSTATSGSTVHRGFERIFSICRVGDYIYYENGYNEGRGSHFKFDINNPQVCLNAFVNVTGADSNMESNHNCTDGVRIYRGGVDPFSTNKSVSFVFATLAADDSEVLFSEGTPVDCVIGRTYPKAISVVTNVNARVSGMAVQTGSSGFLFVTRKGLNNLYVHDKITGELAQTISITGVNKVAVDSSNNLWVQDATTIKKHSVNGDGSLDTASVTIVLATAGITDVQGMACNGTTLWIADGVGSHQIKRFNSSGASVSTFGTAGGYSTSAAYSNSKFYFNDPANRLHTSAFAFESDGSYWVIEPGNFSVKKYNSSDVYQDKLQYLPKVWSHTSLPGRSFADYLEFEVENDPLTWEQVANWGYVVPANRDDNFKRLYSLQVVPNGKTMAFQKKASGSGWEFVELVPGGVLTFTGAVVSSVFAQIYPDGTVRRQNCTNSVTNAPQNFYKKVYNYDASVPVGGAETIIETSPPKTANDPLDWGTRLEPYSAGEQLPDGSIVSWSPNADSYGSKEGFHLGILKAGEWIAKFAKGTFQGHKGQFPDDGRFDIGNFGTNPDGSVKGNAGGKIRVVGGKIWQDFHGEFWKSQDGPGQTNMINIYDANGIFLGQFGTTTWDSKHLGEAAPGMAGNAFFISVEQEGDTYYVKTNDESFHGGIGVWEVTGFDTLENWSSSVRIDQPVPKPSKSYIDLLDGLPHRAAVLVTGGRITRSEGQSGSNENSDMWDVRTGVKTYDISMAPDIYARFGANTARTKDFYIALGDNTGLTSWSLTSKVNWDRHYPNQDSNNGFWMDILDNANKVIARVHCGISLGGSYPITVYGNNTTIVTGTETEMKFIIERWRDLSISCAAGSVTFTYNGTTIVTGLLDGTADWTKPTKIRCWFKWTTGSNQLKRTFGIKEAHFNKVGSTDPEIGGFKWTSEEMDFWVQRFLDKKPYVNKGDVKTNSPDDWAQIVASANQLVNNPYIDRYDGPTTNLGPGGYVQQNSTPEPAAKGARILDAAYAGRVIYQAGVKTANPALIDQGTAYINAAKTALMDQIGRSGVDFSNSTRWQNGKIGDVNPGFQICEWIARLLCAFDFVKSFCSGGQITSFDTWLLNAATFWNNDLNHSTGVNQWFTNRDSPSRPDVLTLSAAGLSPGQGASYYGKKTHDGGDNIITFNTHWNNRRTSIAEMLCFAGCYLNNSTFKTTAKWWVKDVLKYGVFPNGMHVDFERGWNGGTPSGSAGHEQGLDYAAGVAENFGDMADALARTGDKELFTYSTSAGEYGTAGGPKTLKKMMDVIKSAYTKIGWTVNGNLLDGENGTWKSDRLLGLLIANTYYYKDNSINEAILRNTPGMNPYPATPAKPGPYRSSTGNGGQHAGKYFMYARPSLSLTFSPYPS